MSSNFKKFSLLIVFLVAAILSGCISEDTEPSEKMPADEIAVDASQSMMMSRMPEVPRLNPYPLMHRKWLEELRE